MPSSSTGVPLIISLNGTLIPANTCALGVCPLDYAHVQYVPLLAANIAYLAVFAAVLLIQFILGITYRTWEFSTAIVFGLLLEVLGYLGRLGLHYDPFDFNYFLMNLIPLTIGPAFLTAAIYLSLSRLIVVHGVHHARFAPHTYTIIFVTCDLVSLVLQAAGGGLAATANNASGSQMGVNIMIAGLAFQVVSLVAFMALCGDYWWRGRRSRGYGGAAVDEYAIMKGKKMFRLFPWALFLATLTIFVRCVFRVAELKGGFSGHLANDEVLFMVFEGPMIMIAAIALAVFHPGACFSGAWKASKPIGPRNGKKLLDERNADEGFEL